MVTMRRAVFVAAIAAAYLSQGQAWGQSMSPEFAQASEMSKVWKAQSVRQSGVFDRGEYTFVVSTISARHLGDIRYRQLASLDAGKILFQEAVRRAAGTRKLSSLDEAVLRTVSGTLRLKTKQIYASRAESLFVLGMRTADFEQEVRKLNIDNLLSRQRRAISGHPQEVKGFFEKVQLGEVEKLNRILRGEGKDAVVIDKEITSSGGLDQVCLRVQKQSDLPASQTHTENIAWPVLRAVMNAQGFVRFEKNIGKETPAVMPEVLKRFASGSDLALVTYLLESAVETSAANAQVWEYLEAAYRAGGQPQKALIAARVWYLLAHDNRTENLKRLLEDQNNEAGAHFLQYLRNHDH